MTLGWGWGQRWGLLISHNFPILAPMRQRPAPASPYLAGVLTLVQSCTHHVIGDDTRVEDLALFRAQDSDPEATQALVVLH